MSAYDIEAEQSLLGSMLKENQVTEIARALVNASDFSVAEHAQIYSAYLRMFASGEKFTAKTVPNGCEEVAGKLIAITSVHARHYAMRVSRAAKLRRLASMAVELTTECADVKLSNETDTEQFFQAWQERLLAATTISKREPSKRMGDVCAEVFVELEDNSKKKNQLRGASMGIDAFDEICRGMRRSDTYIISARAGVGKTALMLTALRGAAKGGSRALVYSYEMKPSMLVRRMFTATARVSGSKLDSGDLNEADMIKLSTATGELAPLPIWFEERGTIADIRAAAIEQHRTQGLDLLVVDHVGLVDTIGRAQNREREVAEISRGLKSIATTLNIPVLILAQLNRQADPAQEPSLSELRESGSLEQDASVVIMLWASTENETVNEVQWKIAKNRHGAAGRKGVLSFYRDTQLITDRGAAKFGNSAKRSLTDESMALAPGWDRLAAP
jgi:replicative DNA helicase